MSLSNPQKAVLLAVREMEDDHIARDLPGDAAWEGDEVLDLARGYDGGARAALRTVSALCARCLLYLRSDDDRYELTEAGRARLRRGL